MAKISIVIPCYCSADTLPLVTQRIKAAIAGEDYELILVNDCSPDNTYEVIRDIAGKEPNVLGIDLARNFGQHSAIFAGLHYATGEEIVCLDDDGQTPPEGIPKLLAALREGQDVVYARYSEKHHSGFRNFGSRLNSLMAEKLIGKPKELFLSSFFAMKRYVLLEILKYENPFVYIQGLILRTSRHICNVDIEHQERLAGRSGYSLPKLFKLWLNGFTAFSIKPLRIADLFGVGLAGAGFLYLLYTIVSYFIQPGPTVGWNSLMAVLLMVGGSIMLMLGMIGEYLGRVYISINRAPQFVVRSMTKAACDTKRGKAGKTISELKIGDNVEKTHYVSREDMVKYAALTGDYNPIHFDEKFAQETIFKKNIAHGMLGAGFISEAVGMELPGPGSIYEKQDLNFLAPIYCGDKITVRVEVMTLDTKRGRVTLRTTCKNQDGKDVIVGTATVLPNQVRR